MIFQFGGNVTSFLLTMLTAMKNGNGNSNYSKLLLTYNLNRYDLIIDYLYLTQMGISLSILMYSNVITHQCTEKRKLKVHSNI